MTRLVIFLLASFLLIQGYTFEDELSKKDSSKKEDTPKKALEAFTADDFKKLNDDIKKLTEDAKTGTPKENEPAKKDNKLDEDDKVKTGEPEELGDAPEDVMEDELDEILKDMDKENTKRKAIFFGFFSRIFGSRRRSSSSKPSGGSSSGGSAGDDETVKRECLRVHNEKRALHKNTPPMTYDDNLAKDCKKYAQYLASINTMKHSSGNYGENLYYAWSSAGKSISGSAAHASNSWYNEIHDYSFWTGRSKNGKKVGHFTQMVWDDSTKLGCGAGLSADGKTIMVVARYLPPGNWRGEYKQHVHPLK